MFGSVSKKMFVYRLCVSTILLFFLSSPAFAGGHWTQGEDHDRLWYAQNQEIKKAFPKQQGPLLSSPHAFLRLGLRWDGPQHIEWQARFSVHGKQWSSWKSLQNTFSEGVVHNNHVDTIKPGTRYAQLRWIGEGQPTFMAVELITRLGPYKHTPSKTKKKDALPPGVGQSQSALTGPFNARSKWGAAKAKCTTFDAVKRQIAIHHTVTPTKDTVPAERRLRGIQSYHQGTRGWCDIGYHLLISGDGRAWEGRPAEVLGSHVGGNNAGTLGISFMGTFSTTTPDSKMLCTGAKLIDWGVKTFKMSQRKRSHIKGHREFPRQTTSCPGNGLFNQINYMIAQSSKSGACSSGPPPTKMGTLRGVIFLASDKTMGTRIGGATVKIPGQKTITTPSNGSFSWSLPAGTYTLTASKAGYQTASRQATVTANQTTWASTGLSKAGTPTDKTPPKVTITSPKDKQSFQTNRITVKGEATDNKGVVRVTVNGQQVQLAAKGLFQFSMTLKPGSQTIKAIAYDAAGNQGSAQVQVSYNTPSPEPKPEPITPIPDAGTPPGPDQSNPPIQDNPNTPPPDKSQSSDSGVLQLFCKQDSECERGEKCVNKKCEKLSTPPEKKGCGCEQNQQEPVSIFVFCLLLLALLSRQRKTKSL